MEVALNIFRECVEIENAVQLCHAVIQRALKATGAILAWRILAIVVATLFRLRRGVVSSALHHIEFLLRFRPAAGKP